MSATLATSPVRVTGSAVSVRCAQLLEGPEQDLDVLAALPAAVYLATRRPRAEVVALLAADAVIHPAAFVIAAPSAMRPFADLDRTTSATIGAGRLRVGELEVQVGRWYEPVPHLRVPTTAGLAAALRTLRTLRGTGVDPQGGRQREQLGRLASALARDDVDGALDAVDALLGSGPGLTPTGDDQLAGMLATLHHLRRGAPQPSIETTVRTYVRDNARARTTLLSAALLEHALDGAVAAPVARLMRHLTAGTGSAGSGGTAPVLVALSAVIGIGATSGRDLLDGITTAFELVAAEHAIGSEGPSDGRSVIDDEGAS
jgi:hypothetical protein